MNDSIDTHCHRLILIYIIPFICVYAVTAGCYRNKTLTLTYSYVCARYLGRFDEELEQIELVNSIKGRSGLQHAARLQSIKITMETERQEYESVGLGELWPGISAV